MNVVQKTEVLEEMAECYVCGKDLDRNQNEVKCETCSRCYHVSCLNISCEDKLMDIRLVWICICGNNNISMRLFDHLGIPIDVNRYESICPERDVEEHDYNLDEGSKEETRDRCGRFTMKKRYVNKGQKRSRSPDLTNTKKRKNEMYVPSVNEPSNEGKASDMEKESDSRWKLTRSRKAKYLEKKGGLTSINMKERNVDEFDFKREKGVTYIGKSMKHLYYKSPRINKASTTVPQSEMKGKKEKSKACASREKKPVEMSGNDLELTCRGTVCHEDTKLCGNGFDEDCSKSSEMAILFSKQKAPSEWSVSDIDDLVTHSVSSSSSNETASHRKNGGNASPQQVNTGPISEHAHPDSLLNTLQESLENCDGCLMNFGKQTFLVFADETGYYIFDPHSRSRRGCYSRHGKSILMHTKTWLGVYSYCIQLCNSLKLPHDVTYKLTQVVVMDRTKTDVLKLATPPNTIAQVQVDDSLDVPHTEMLTPTTEPTCHSEEEHGEELGKPSNPSDETPAVLKPCSLKSNCSRNESFKISLDFEVVDDPKHTHETEFEPKNKVTSDMKHKQQRVDCDVAQKTDSANCPESMENKAPNEDVILKAKPTTHMMDNPGCKNMQCASQCNNDFKSESICNKSRTKDTVLKGEQEDKCTRVNTQIKQVAQGTFNQGDRRFGYSSGKQCVANSLSALMYSKVKNASDWSSTDLDRILHNGDELYCYIRHFNSVDHEFLLISDLFDYLDSYDELFEIKCRESVGGLLDGDESMLAQSLTMPLNRILEQELCSDSDACFVTFGGCTFMIISGQDGFFIFDSHSRSRRGLLIEQGYSILLHTPSWQGVYKHCMRLAKTMGCPMCTECEVTSVNVKTTSGKSETLKGYPQLHDIPSGQLPSRSGQCANVSECSIQYDSFDELPSFNQSSTEESIQTQDLSCTDNANDPNMHFNGQQLKLKSVTIELTKLTETQLNSLCSKKGNIIKAVSDNDKKQKTENCTLQCESDLNDSELGEKLQNRKRTMSGKRKLKNIESDVEVSVDPCKKIRKTDSRQIEVKENNDLKIDENECETDPEELLILSEVRSTMWFKPLDEIRRKQCCRKVEIPDVDCHNSDYRLEVCTPLTEPRNIKHITGDGNCFYRAISFAITGNEGNHTVLRKAIVVHLLKNKEIFVSLLRTGYTSVADYISKSNILDNGTWATEMEIMVLANLIETDIYVYNDQLCRWSIFCGRNIQVGSVTTEKGIYLKHTHCIHYDVVLSVQSSESFSLDSEVDVKGNNISEMPDVQVKTIDRKTKKRRTPQSYNQTKVRRRERMREKRALMKKENKSNDKKDNDMSYKIKKQRQNIKYRHDIKFQKTHLNTMKSKYSDLQHRSKLLQSNKQKYITNEKYKENHKSAMRIKMRDLYTTNEHFKQKHSSIMRRSTRNKYKENDHFKQTQKATMRVSMRNKYKENDHFKQRQKATMRNKYQKNDHFKQTQKATMKSNMSHKYKGNENFRQKQKVSMKNLSQTRYKNIDIKQQKLLSLKMKYKTNENFRQSVMRQNTERAVAKTLEMSKFDNVLQEFRKIISHGPEFVCCVCFKLLFQNQVRTCRKTNYKLQRCINEEYLHVCDSQCKSPCQISQSTRSSLWICFTCHNKLKSGKVPAEANVNNLHLHRVPVELANLNSLEQHLIALNIPFMKLMALPRGGQNGVHGPVVCVPSNTYETVEMLPRPQTEDQLIRVKLKRKLSFKSYYKYKFVDKTKLMNALLYLKGSNKWYLDIGIDNKWTNTLDQNENDNETEVLETFGETDILKDIRELEEERDKEKDKIDDSRNAEMKGNNESEDDLEERLCGIQLDTCLQPADIGQEILDQYFDDIICCAPCEGKSPVSVLQDESNEAKCFPVLFPQGQPTFHDRRNEKITLGRYLQNRLMHVDNRFARSTDYIFYAQYIYEIQQVLSQVSIALRQSRDKKDDTSTITASDLKDADTVHKILKSDKGYKFLKQIRGTPPYWQKTQKDVMAMVRQLGKPTWFASFSAADMRWPEIINTLLTQQGDSRKSTELDWTEKCNLLRSNPVTVARMFDKRFHTFMNKVILSPAAPIGKIIDMVYRVEYQARGSPHIHSLLWVENAPELGIDKDKDVIRFIDKYISCQIPDEKEDPELYEIVSTVQQHSKKHSKSCKKKGTACRFHFPKPPSERTFIIKPVINKASDSGKNQCDVKASEKAKSDAKKLLNSVKDALSDGSEYKSTRHLFEKLGITQTQFEKAHNEIASQDNIIIKRDPQDVWVNQFNPNLLRCWNANMDLQYVTNPYACVAYIVSYMSKAEREMGMLLNHTLTEMEQGNKDAKESMKKIGQAYMQNREVSAQESVYRVCSLRLKECSRKVEFIPVGPDPVRMSLPLSVIQNKPDGDDDQNIWMPSKLDRYKARPRITEFKNMCLATFCSQYRILTASQEPSTKSKNVFKLDNNLGYIQKRTRTKDAIIRYPRFSASTSPDKYYLSILQLFLPHYYDEQLKPPTFKTHQEFYEKGSVKLFGCEIQNVRSIVCTNQSVFEISADAIDKAQEHLNKFGPQEDAWGLLCPETEVERLEHPRESVDLEDCDGDLDIPDFKREPKKDDYSIEFRSTKISKQNGHSLMRSLNEKQQSVFYKVRQWCLDTVNGKVVEPFHIFITGGAGTGKSHLVKSIYYEVSRILARMLHHPDDVSVLKVAPTGVAAYNINGHTIHSVLSIPINAQMPYQPLSEEKISVLRNKLSQLQILIIDEISMVDQKLMYYIHSRLRQIKQSRNQTAFAGVSVIAVGDMYQLPPVFGNSLYNDTLEGGLWNDNFKKVELEDIMRQKDDIKFAHLLNRLRVKEHADILCDEDISLLTSRETGEECANVLHIYSSNKEVDAWNKKLLHKKCDDVICIKAEDTEKDARNGNKIREKPCTRKKNQLPNYLWIAVNARVMLIKNIDVNKGLTNGCFGNVVEIIWDQTKSKPVCIRVDFDKADVGIHSIKLSQESIGKKIIRQQFPLKLAYACTIHKVQGLTLDKAVVSLKTIFQSGQAYVGLSRVTSLSGLVIENFDQKRIHCNPQIKESMDKMTPFIEESTSEDVNGHNFSLIMQNIQGLKQHFIDFKSQCQFLNTDFICLTETWIKDENIFDVLIDNFRFYHQPRHLSYCNSGDGKQFKEQSHGGVAMYIKHVHVSRLKIPVDNLEFIAVLITNPISVVISVVYRPPLYSMKSFCECLDNLLNELHKRSTRCIVMGDFNEDLFKDSSQVKKLMCNRGYKQHVSSATTENGTLIDHVYSKGLDSVETEVVGTYYSYHEAVRILF